ncbi:MAG: polyprenol monophosphomannose synthase [Desulfobacterales bacterium]
MRDWCVVLPTYNEADNLPGIANDLLALDAGDMGILVVDDASPDGTGDVADELSEKHPGRVHVIHRPSKLGLGTAYVDGFRWAIQRGARNVIQMDADYSHSVHHIPKFLELIKAYDLVIGSRYIAGGSVYPNRTAARSLLSWWANSLLSPRVLGPRVKDATSGFRCWRATALEAIGLDRIRSKGYVFQVEMCHLAHRQGLRIIETPIHFDIRRHGKSKMSLGIQVEAIAWFLGMFFHFRR